MSNDKLELSRAEVDAIVDYLHMHVRAATNGKAYKVWKRMIAFQSRLPEKKKRRVDVGATLDSVTSGNV